jgi:hypothetical protein
MSEFDKDASVEQFKQDLASKTNVEVSNELAALELEEKQLDLEIKRETVAKIRAQRNAKLDEARAKMIATKQFLAQREANQANCNHRKGGIGAEAVMRGQGTDAMYAVIKHKLPNGRYFVLCQRCGKEWHPGFPLLGEKETAGYREALNFATDNSPSGSSTFIFERTESLEERSAV